MAWWQLIIAILGSGTVTALVTGIFTLIGNTKNNKFNQQRYEQDRNDKDKVIKCNNEIARAEHLYNIIKPAIYCEALRFYINDPSLYKNDIFSALYEYLCNDNDAEYEYSKYKLWLKSYTYKFSPACKLDVSFDAYVIKLIEKDLKEQVNLQDFFLRYTSVIEEPTVGLLHPTHISFNVLKLNEDISYINDKLNMCLEYFNSKND